MRGMQAMSDKTHLVLTNWRRPRNLPAIIDSFDDYVGRITLVDNSLPEYRFDHSYSRWVALDDVWQIRQNGGPPIRFAAGLQYMRHEYTLFWDDDLVPKDGGDLVARFEYTAQRDAFAELGIIGRRFGPNGEYVRRNVRRGSIVTDVDMCCRAHFVKTHEIPAIYEFRNLLAQHLLEADGDIDCLERHDDLLCIGLQFASGCPAKLITLPEGQREDHNDLDDSHALGARPDFVEERTALIQVIQRLRRGES